MQNLNLISCKTSIGAPTPPSPCTVSCLDPKARRTYHMDYCTPSLSCWVQLVTFLHSSPPALAGMPHSCQSNLPWASSSHLLFSGTVPTRQAQLALTLETHGSWLILYIQVLRCVAWPLQVFWTKWQSSNVLMVMRFSATRDPLSLWTCSLALRLQLHLSHWVNYATKPSYLQGRHQIHIYLSAARTACTLGELGAPLGCTAIF